MPKGFDKQIIYSLNSCIMSTTQKNRPNVQGTEAKKENEKIVDPANENGATHSNGKAEIKLLEEKPKVGEAPVKSENEPGKPQAEQAKDEVKPVNRALNLEGTLKVVEGLHRKSLQRINLLDRIKQLETFEIAQMEDSDELESNHFQGCQLIISDDKNRKFVTNTAGLIKLVSQFIYDACQEKLTEIEANIVFPNA